MKGIVRIAIKFVVYIVIVFPLVGFIVGIIFDGWLGWLLGAIVSLGLAFWLETTGTSNKILAHLFNAATGEQTPQSSGTDQLTDSLGASKGLETTMKCPNCGSQVTLINGHGKCRSCDSAF